MSIRVASTSLISGAVVVGKAGHGVLAQQIATTGDYGAGYAYSSLSFPADNGKEIRGLITTQPATGVLTAFEDTSFTYVGSNGAHTFQYQIYVDGIALGTPQTATINVGASSSTVTSVTVSPATATGSTTFTAVVNGTGSPSQAVNWACTIGSINSSGVFTPPAQTGSVQTGTVSATSVQNGSVAPGTATVTIAVAGSAVYVPSTTVFANPYRPASYVNQPRLVRLTHPARPSSLTHPTRPASYVNPTRPASFINPVRLT